MALVSGTVGLSVMVEVEVDDPTDADAVEEALAAAGVKGLKDNYGLDVKIKDIVIFSEWAENDDHEPVL
jgi:hypothetical protein